MDNSTTWANTNNTKKNTKKNTNKTTPSNLKHLPLETYMIPTDTKADEVIDVSGGSATSSTKTTATSYIKKIIEIFCNLAAVIDMIETYVATTIAQSLSDKKNTSTDVALIKQNLMNFLNVLLSCYIVYNLYFCMFFKDVEGKQMKQFEFSIGELRTSNSIIHFFVKYILCTLSMMVTMIKDLIPEYVEKFVKIDPKIDKIIHFMLLFVHLFRGIFLGTINTERVEGSCRIRIMPVN